MVRKNNLCQSYAVMCIWNDHCGRPQKMKDLIKAFEAEMSHATVSKFIAAQVACGNAEKGEGRLGKIILKASFEDAFACARALSFSGINCMHDGRRFTAACEARQIKTDLPTVEKPRRTSATIIKGIRSAIVDGLSELEINKSDLEAKKKILEAKRENLFTEIEKLETSISGIQSEIAELSVIIDTFKSSCQ